jgi:hypothetical protein
MVRGWLVAILLLATGIGSAETLTWESQGGQVTLVGGSDTNWVISSKFGTSDGTLDGTCNQTGTGLAIKNAILDLGGPNEKGGTFDAGLTVWIDGALFSAPPTFDLTGTTLTSGPVTMSGLEVTVQHTAIPTQPVLRTLLTLHNPGATPAEAQLRVVSNFASNADTEPLTPENDEVPLLVTSDDPTTPIGAPIVSVWGGVGGPHGFGVPNLGFGLDTEAFPCAGTEGVRLADDLVVPPGETLYFLLFTQLAATNAAALAAAATYESDLAPALLDGLDDTTKLHTVNFNFLGEIELVGGGPGTGSRWYVENLAQPDNGAPTGGACSSGPALCVEDAILDPDGDDRVDPFDNAAMIFVGGHPFASSLHPIVTSSTFTDGPSPVGGLDTTVSYAALPGSATLRTLATFTNAGASTVTATVTLAANVGSDDGTTVRGSSSGDLALDGADRWIVTSDGKTPAGDAVVTHVLAGPGTIAIPPSLVSSEVFDCSTTKGIRAEFPLTVPPGETRGLLFFYDLHATSESAVASASTYDAAPGAALLDGIAPSQLAHIVNWPFCANDPGLCDDGDACTVDACAATGGCSRSALPATADFLSVGCRMTDLVARVNALPAGKVRDALAAKLAAAQTAASTAQGLVGQEGAYRKALRRAGKALKAFEKRLKAKAAKKALDQATRDDLKAQSSGLRDHLKSLAAAV